MRRSPLETWTAFVSVMVTSALAAAGPESVARFPDLPDEPAPQNENRSPEAPPPSSSTATPGTAHHSTSWAQRSARRAYEKAQMYERHQRYGRAMAAYLRAIRADRGFGPAYLGLARLRERVGDRAEAERIYTRAIRLDTVAAESLARRAMLRHRDGRRDAALRDLRAAVEVDPYALEPIEQLARWLVEDQNWAAALAVHRRLEAALRHHDNERRAREVHVQIRALALLAGDTDPVGAGQGDANWVRRSLATIALE